MDKFFDFIKNSPTAYHAVEFTKNVLLKHHAQELFFNQNWKLELGHMYYIVKDDGSIIAFKIGKNIQLPSFQIVATHTDSPMLKIKPHCLSFNREYTKINSEVYGGLIYSTFLDRPLGIAGRVMVKKDNKLQIKKVIFPQTLVIPNVCIHMNPTINNGYQFNPQIDLQAILSLNNLSFDELLESVKIDGEILDFDLFLYNKELPRYAGMNNEMILSPRLDNLECLYTSLDAFVESENDYNINMFVAFNHEEIGSNSNNAAGSTFLMDTIDLILSNFNLLEKKQQILCQSMLVSADNAHAEHPNHPEKTDANNAVYMNKGIVIKYSARLSYTSNAISAGLFKSLLNDFKIPYQLFANRSDQRGGSTLGCILLQSVSILSVDIGLAQLAMHSAYETAGVYDLDYMNKALKAFYSKHLDVREGIYSWN